MLWFTSVLLPSSSVIYYSCTLSILIKSVFIIKKRNEEWKNGGGVRVWGVAVCGGCGGSDDRYFLV